MKTTIRRSTFETNSSSCHTLILIPYDVADAWIEQGDDYWLDLNLVETDATNSGNGYGEIDMTQAPASIEHLVSKSEVVERGEWREGGAYYDDIYAQWKMPLDVLRRPDYYLNDSWSSIASFEKIDEGYLVMVEL